MSYRITVSITHTGSLQMAKTKMRLYKDTNSMNLPPTFNTSNEHTSVYQDNDGNYIQ